MSTNKKVALAIYAVLAVLAVTMGDSGVGVWSLRLLGILALAQGDTEEGLANLNTVSVAVTLNELLHLLNGVGTGGQDEEYRNLVLRCLRPDRITVALTYYPSQYTRHPWEGCPVRSESRLQ